MSEWAPKVFWTKAEAVEAEGGWTVALDGRRVRTPAKAPLVVPTQGLAQAMAAEWAAQQDKVDPTTMPFTRTANAAIDKVVAQHAEVAQMLADYGDSDLLCYRAETPRDLADRQAASWDPILEWAADRYGARLQPRAGVMHAPQSPQALEKLGAAVAAQDQFRLAAFHDLVTISGSLVMGLAAAEGAFDIDQLWQASRVDEAYQIEQWGDDEEAAETTELKRQAFLHANRFYSLC